MIQGRGSATSMRLSRSAPKYTINQCGSGRAEHRDTRYKEQPSYGKSSPTSSSDAKMTILDKSENHGAGWAAAAPGHTVIQVFQLGRKELLGTP